MEQVKFANGTKLECLGVHSSQVNYQGVARDCYTFLFDPDKVSLAEIERQFTAENCGRLALLTDKEFGHIVLDEATGEAVLDEKTGKQQVVTETVTEEFVHEHYTIRAGFGCGLKEPVIYGGIGYGDNIGEPPEVVNWVKMLQSTLAERSIESQQEVLDALVVEALSGEVE